jgi:hypothetical protein
MKKIIWAIPIFAALLVIFLVILNKGVNAPEQATIPTKVPEESENITDEQSVGMANPASVYCEENGGDLEVVTKSDGSQFGLCNLEDYSCEEWAYYRGECNIEKDAELIKQALIDKGLDLSDMKVEITTHLGNEMGGMVVPVSAPAGGGYVFAVKGEDGMEIVADGNGVIMCGLLENYPDFSTYLISECFDEDTSSSVIR